MNYSLYILTIQLTIIKGIMNSKNMRMPNMEQIFNQKSQYQQHKRKLHSIYEERKSHLGFNSLRMKEFHHIKENKTKSFISKFNQKTDIIAKQNLRFLGKLENTKSLVRKRSVSEERDQSSYSYIKPYLKQRMFQTEKQNVRISNRMKNMSSSLNQKSLIRDYTKSQQIKNRLMRYTTDQDNKKVWLKSERYLNEEGDNQSILSKSNKSLSKKKDFKVKLINRKSVINHYRKEQILKNKIDSTNNLAEIKAKNKFRPNTSFQTEKNPENSFFQTEPKKSGPYLKKRHL